MSRALLSARGHSTSDVPLSQPLKTSCSGKGLAPQYVNLNTCSEFKLQTSPVQHLVLNGTDTKNNQLGFPAVAQNLSKEKDRQGNPELHSHEAE